MEPTTVQTPQPGTEQENVTPQKTPAGEIPDTTVNTPETPGAPETPQTPAAQTPPDYQKKFSQSAAEAQILLGRNKVLEDRYNKLTSQDTPTEAELREAYPSWDSMNAVEKDVYKNILTERKRNNRIEATLLEMTAEQRFTAEMNALLAKPEYSVLHGDAEFTEFVLRPKHKGLDIQTLADAYLFKKGLKEPETPTSPVQRDPGLPKGSGGPRTTEQPGLSDDEVATIRKTDPKRFRQMLKTGEIKL